MKLFFESLRIPELTVFFMILFSLKNNNGVTFVMYIAKKSNFNWN